MLLNKSSPKKAKQAISPLIATIILISITIALGLTIYTITQNTLTTLTTSLDIQIQSVDLIKAGSNTLFAATIKNTGTTHITTATINLTGETGSTNLTLTNIEPGKTASTTKTNPPTLNVINGNTYPIIIHITANQNTLTKALTVKCS